AIDLAGVVGHVTVMEFLDQMRADQVLQDKLRSLPNVDIELGRRTVEVAGDGRSVTGIVHEPRDGGDAVTTELEGVFVQIGLLPNTEWVADVLDRNAHGEIEIDPRGATNVPGVFAAGDCTTVSYKQITTASGAAASASLSASDHLIPSTVAGPEPAAGWPSRPASLSTHPARGTRHDSARPRSGRAESSRSCQCPSVRVVGGVITSTGRWV